MSTQPRLVWWWSRTTRWKNVRRLRSKLSPSNMLQMNIKAVLQCFWTGRKGRLGEVTSCGEVGRPTLTNFANSASIHSLASTGFRYPHEAVFSAETMGSPAAPSLRLTAL